jgi:hypothetical protein
MLVIASLRNIALVGSVQRHIQWELESGSVWQTSQLMVCCGLLRFIFVSAVEDPVVNYSCDVGALNR